MSETGSLLAEIKVATMSDARKWAEDLSRMPLMRACLERRKADLSGRIEDSAEEAELAAICEALGESVVE